MVLHILGTIFSENCGFFVELLDKVGIRCIKITKIIEAGGFLFFSHIGHPVELQGDIRNSITIFIIVVLLVAFNILNVFGKNGLPHFILVLFGIALSVLCTKIGKLLVD